MNKLAKILLFGVSIVCVGLVREVAGDTFDDMKDAISKKRQDNFGILSVRYDKDTEIWTEERVKKYSLFPLANKSGLALIVKILEGEMSAQLLEAVEKGKEQWIRNLFKNTGRLELDKEPYLYKDGSTLLEKAVEKNYYEIAGLLISNGADVNRQNEKGETPLHLAASKLYYDMVEILLDKEAYVNLTDENGKTSLHLAASTEGPIFVGMEKTIFFLIKKGAKLNIIDNNYKTPLDYLIEHKYSFNEILNSMIYFVSYGALTYKLVKEREKLFGNENKEKLLIEQEKYQGVYESMIRGINNKVTRNAKFSEKYGSAIQEKLETVKGKYTSLLGIKNKEGQTLLHKAVEKENEELIEYLISNCSELLAEKNAEDLTPFMLLIKQFFDFAFHKKDPNDSLEEDKEKVKEFLKKYKETAQIFLKKYKGLAQIFINKLNLESLRRGNYYAANLLNKNIKTYGFGVDKKGRKQYVTPNELFEFKNFIKNEFEKAEKKSESLEEQIPTEAKIKSRWRMALEGIENYWGKFGNYVEKIFPPKIQEIRPKEQEGEPPRGSEYEKEFGPGKKKNK